MVLVDGFGRDGSYVYLLRFYMYCILYICDGVILDNIFVFLQDASAVIHQFSPDTIDPALQASFRDQFERMIALDYIIRNTGNIYMCVYMYINIYKSVYTLQSSLCSIKSYDF